VRGDIKKMGVVGVPGEEPTMQLCGKEKNRSGKAEKHYRWEGEAGKKIGGEKSAIAVKIVLKQKRGGAKGGGTDHLSKKQNNLEREGKKIEKGGPKIRGGSTVADC